MSAALQSSEAAGALRAAAAERILLIDGAYGTMIQGYGLDEAGYAGATALGRDQKGNNDLLSLTRPEIIAEITRGYLDAGSHIVTTNSFNSNSISQADYGAEHLVRELNLASAAIARTEADAAAGRDGVRRFVAGALGPTNKTLSMSPRVDDPGYREIDFDQLTAIYAEQVSALVDGGCDFILVETIFDTLNAKAAVMATLNEGERRGIELPLMISMTITDMAGRNLSGHSVEAFWYAIRHARPLTIGLNCSFGAEQLRPHVQTLAAEADALLMVYPNAGLPNDLGEYDERPETTARLIDGWAKAGLINIVGGCCGTTPAHIAAIAGAVAGRLPRALPVRPPLTRLAGLDPMTIAA